MRESHSLLQKPGREDKVPASSSAPAGQLGQAPNLTGQVPKYHLMVDQHPSDAAGGRYQQYAQKAFPALARKIPAIHSLYYIPPTTEYLCTSNQLSSELTQMRKRLALDKKLSEDRKILQELQMENTKLEDEKRKLEEEIRRHNQHWTEEWETPLKNRIEGVRQDRQKLSKDLRGIQEAIRAVWEGWKGLLK
jgi:hypothetical protein